MNKIGYVSNNNLGIMVIITLCCVVARGSSEPLDLSWDGWKRNIRTYMTTRNPDEPYSRDSLRTAFDRFDQSLSQDHTLTIYWRGVRAIAEIIRQVEFKAIGEHGKDR